MYFRHDAFPRRVGIPSSGSFSASVSRVIEVSYRVSPPPAVAFPRGGKETVVLTGDSILLYLF